MILLKNSKEFESDPIYPVKYEKYKSEKGDSILVDKEYQSIASKAFKEAMGSK
jgi:hypothetical protein